MRRPSPRRVMLIGVVVTVGFGLIGAAIYGFLQINRPKPPPPADPRAGLTAISYCVNAINNEVARKAVVVNVQGGEKAVVLVEMAGDLVRVVYSTKDGRTEDALYDAATFATRVIGQVNSPTAKIVGLLGLTWLSCTKALQYYEQEKAKDVARELQTWVFGDPRVEDGSIEGTHQLVRTLNSCVAESGCRTENMPVQIACDINGKPSCAIRRLDEFWDREHELKFDGSSWTTSGPDMKALFGPCSPRLAQIELSLTPTAAEFVNGVWTATKLRGSYNVVAPASGDCSEARGDYTLKSSDVPSG